MSEPVAIIPVKRFGAAKQRLLEVLDAAERAGLVEAMLTDVLDAASRSERLGRVVVVSGDSRAEQSPYAPRSAPPRRSRSCATPTTWVIPRRPCSEWRGRRSSAPTPPHSFRGTALCSIRSSSTPPWSAVHGDRVAIVPDRHGTGTNALVLAPPDAIAPAFGPGSCARHAELGQRAGHTVEVERLESLALDLDTPADLAEMITALGRDPDRAPTTTVGARAHGPARDRVARMSPRVELIGVEGLPEIEPGARLGDLIADGSAGRVASSRREMSSPSRRRWSRRPRAAYAISTQ